MSTILQVVGERVAVLEKLIYGSTLKFTSDKFLLGISAIESLLNTNVFICSALSGREHVNALINRLSELSNYIDSNFENCDLQRDAKLEYILTLETQMEENLRLLTDIQNLTPMLQIDKIMEVPDMSKRLSLLTLQYLQLNEKCKIITGKIHDLFANYNSVINGISESLISMDANITTAEMNALPKIEND